MADAESLKILHEGVERWNEWRAANNSREVDLSGADLTRLKLNEINFLRTNLSGAILVKTQLEQAHLKDADLSGADLRGANLEHVNAREAIFDNAVASAATDFTVATLRGASFRNARLAEAKFHRAYLRDADLTGAILTGASLRFATLDDACCRQTNFAGADLRYASMVQTDLRGADLSDVQVYGLSAWNIETDANTRQDLIVDAKTGEGGATLRTSDLRTAQLLALMLDGTGIRRVFDAVASKLVLILGSFSPTEKPVLDALRNSLQGHGYVAVTFDFERPADRDYAETVVVLAGLSRFVIADFTDAKEVRAEVLQIRSQYHRVPIIPIARAGAKLPITMANAFSPEQLELLVRYETLDDLLLRLRDAVIEPAERAASLIAAGIAKSEAILRQP